MRSMNLLLVEMLFGLSNLDSGCLSNLKLLAVTLILSQKSHIFLTEASRAHTPASQQSVFCIKRSYNNTIRG